MFKTTLLSAALWLPVVCGAIDVNVATEAELDSIKGLGPSSTARILKARDQGPFKDWADFMARVKGIKPSAASKLSSAGLTVGDAAFAAPAKRPAPTQ
ncbi:MAG: helix-hairpin-helix domain-containing protein [Rhodoferax sp.]|nr:helix-hairpin-helix domain-containing protein [Rhodoferax sp.]MCF8208131.1 helix-hairpin-helix domain-containing protein [Rhodoferax sp.]